MRLCLAKHSDFLNLRKVDLSGRWGPVHRTREERNQIIWDVNSPELTEEVTTSVINELKDEELPAWAIDDVVYWKKHNRLVKNVNLINYNNIYVDCNSNIFICLFLNVSKQVELQNRFFWTRGHAWWSSYFGFESDDITRWEEWRRSIRITDEQVHGPHARGSPGSGSLWRQVYFLQQ